jgi:hypothetical protein
MTATSWVILVSSSVAIAPFYQLALHAGSSLPEQGLEQDVLGADEAASLQIAV